MTSGQWLQVWTCGIPLHTAFTRVRFCPITARATVRLYSISVAAESPWCRFARSAAGTKLNFAGFLRARGNFSPGYGAAKNFLPPNAAFRSAHQCSRVNSKQYGKCAQNAGKSSENRCKRLWSFTRSMFAKVCYQQMRVAAKAEKEAASGIAVKNGSESAVPYIACWQKAKRMPDIVAARPENVGFSVYDRPILVNMPITVSGENWAPTPE